MNKVRTKPDPLELWMFEIPKVNVSINDWNRCAHVRPLNKGASLVLSGAKLPRERQKLKSSGAPYLNRVPICEPMVRAVLILASDS